MFWFGIRLGEGEEAPQAAAERGFGAREPLDRLAVGRVGGGAAGGGARLVARLDDRLQRLAFELHVPLDALDEVGDQVVTPLELDVDLREGVLEPVAQPDQAVVDPRDPGGEQDQDGDGDDQGHGGTSSGLHR